MKLKFTSPLAVLLMASQASGAVVAPDSYSYVVGPTDTTFYLDPGNTKLTDSVSAAAVWPSASPQIDRLVGFQNADAQMIFEFSGTPTIQTVSIWFADSDNGAGVNLPATVTIEAFDGAGATGTSLLNQPFTVTNPAGSGSMVAFSFNGFNVAPASIEVTVENNPQWTMITEVEFNSESVPEPSSVILLSLAGLGLLRRRR